MYKGKKVNRKSLAVFFCDLSLARDRRDTISHHNDWYRRRRTAKEAEKEKKDSSSSSPAEQPPPLASSFRRGRCQRIESRTTCRDGVEFVGESSVEKKGQMITAGRSSTRSS